jgi:outer membrane receptor protein involved in Fe transport
MTTPVSVSRQALVAAAGIIIGLGAVGSAQAQIEEIVVSARRVEENVLEVPIAVSPFSQERIRQLNLQNVDDVALFTPGFSFTSAFGRQPGSDRPAIRGITTILGGIANANAVGYFIDGVYVGGSPQATELANLERIEILRGPQAAQFGRGTYAGAINYVTRKPSDEFEAIVDLQGGSDNIFIGTGSISGPITDGLAYFLSAGYDTIDGQFTNNRDGSDIGGQETTSVTGKLLWEPSDMVDATLRIGYQKTDDDHFAMYLQGREENNTAFRNANSPRSREYYQGTAIIDKGGVNLNTDILQGAAGFSGVQYDRKIFSLTLNVNPNDDWLFSSITGYIEDDIEQALDVSYGGYTFLPFSPAFAGLFNQWDKDEQTDFSQELRGVFTGLEGWRFMFGGYYYKGTNDEIFSRGVGGPGPFQGIVTPLVGVDDTSETIENVAVFGSIDWDVLDNLTLTFEGRYAEDEITVVQRDPGTSEVTQSNNATFDNFTPRFTAVWSLNDDLNLYGNIAKGTKPGTFNDSDECPELPEDVDEEQAWNYEIGLKGSVWDDRATFAVAAYFLDVEDQQLTEVCENPNTGTTASGISNVGKTEITGIEFESTFALTDFWTAGLTYAFTDSEITQAINIDQADLLGSNGSLEQTRELGNIAGQKSPRVPEHQLSLFTRLEGQINAENSWWIAADYAFESSKYSQVHNLIETGDRNLLGGSIGVNLGENWQLSIWGKNLLDDDTPVDVLRYVDRRSGTLPACTDFESPENCAGSSTTPRGFANSLMRERTYGARVVYRFGGM